MNEIKDLEVQEEESDKLKEEGSTKPNWLPVVISIFFGSWIIGMGILGAGWLISKELSKQHLSNLAKSGQSPAQQKLKIEIPKEMPAMGTDTAKVTVVEFADFQCPFCGHWQKEVFPKLKQDFIDTGKIKFVFWDFAFLGEESVRASEAASCALDQGRFWEYHDALFENQNGENEGAFSDARLNKLASSLNLDSKIFASCLKNKTHLNTISERFNKAVEIGISSTPTVSINGYKFEGEMSWENYKKVIESELSK